MASSSSSTTTIYDDDEIEVVYVAVGKDVGESKLTLLWAITNFPAASKFCILHVHQPSKNIPLVGGKFPCSRLEPQELREIRELERKIMLKILDDYLLLCHQSQVRAEKLYIETDDIGKGIVELVYQNDITRLVMGAAADKHYSEKMTEIKSEKAKYVQRLVPFDCQIWFICNRHLILMWEGDSSSEVSGGANPSTTQGTEGTEYGLELSEIPESAEESQSPDELVLSDMDRLYNLLEQAVEEAEKFKKEAYDEYIRRIEAEKSSMKVIYRAKALENLYAEQLKRKKESEEALAKEKEEHQRTKNERDEVRMMLMDQRMLRQIQISEFENNIKELDEKTLSATDMCASYEKKIEEFTKNQPEVASDTNMLQSLSIFSESEIQEATHNFDASMKIGEGGYGIIYKGNLRYITAAIKVLNKDSLQGPAEFLKEVEVLSKLRHPNLVILIGACPEAHALIYEFLPNGDLEDRLRCKENSPPLSWQARIRLATELCSVLIFLHSSKPNGIVHGDFKPGNILLDANLTCKLADFGLCRTLALLENSSNATQFLITDPKGTFHYLDPHFLRTGELSPKSDTYAFGIILLQLLTGRPAFGLQREMENAIDRGGLDLLLDRSAGEWPFVQAKQLASVALKCCGMNRSDRPDLASEVWRVLEPMRASCTSSSVPQFGLRAHQHPPSHYHCPIFHEVMQDPHVAADGFTYEAEALKGWLARGHNTSPITNKELDHYKLVPNRVLRSAIQEWLQTHRNT